MVFLNRRGYAPVLHCSACDWKSECPHCSAYRVFHKIDRTCAATTAAYRTGAARLPGMRQPGHRPVGPWHRTSSKNIWPNCWSTCAGPTRCPSNGRRRTGARSRIDADSTGSRASLQSQLARVHAGEVDVLVGTQMIAKGHDFRRITLVAAVNPDSALFSSDFRAPERLFSLLMQAAGRAGRDAGLSGRSEMWIQTFHPKHPLFEASSATTTLPLPRQQLQERAQAAMPPFSFQALVRSEARTQEVAQGFLTAASAAVAGQASFEPLLAHITLYPAVPMSIQRVANVERAQMLIESPSRTALQRFLTEWQSVLHATRQQPVGKGLIRWAIDVDPLAI
jgi:primosomal protein N' (replication factor Y)